MEVMIFTQRIFKKITRFYFQKSGIINAKDLKSYEAIWRAPLTFPLKLYHSFNGSAIKWWHCFRSDFKMISPYLNHTHTPNSAAYVKLLVEAEKRAYADRAIIWVIRFC